MRVLSYIVTFRWANAVSEVAGYLSALAMVVATGVMVHGVLSRYLFGNPTVWQTEVSIYLLIFVTVFGAAYGLKHHAHVGVDLLVHRLPPRGQLITRLVTSVLSLCLVIAVIWTSLFTWWEAYEAGFRSPTALRAPLSVVYAILPLGMMLVACQFLAFIIEGVQALVRRGAAEEGAALLAQSNPEISSADRDAAPALGHRGAPADSKETLG